ncbi:MAG: hypothetical protein F6J90_07445 [Moorea sp. SIOASIH]|uniref:hypothetical protein n=1 Tax=Moorena sp. SIOASIH TaxID=2607817 RepID=UPI0013B5ED30|nr:hypothetical protein [Moorena sp. SIOASIH]NEO36167.1 hypothetical protein [Moorena sp. SIOASIH]
MRYTKLFTSFLFRLYCSLLRSPCSEVPAPCSLKAKNLYLTSLKTAIMFQQI